uniref:Leucine carboxyl methyltransferase 1 n=1 Tax=Panagrellus redivivus TaxID=6233 RepID=A0A7E4ZVB2_PANRE
MEGEAALGDGSFGAEVGVRRRSASISDDYSVQKTNDDATESKYAAVKLNYYYDNFIDYFTHGVHRRDPEISTGYWARVAAVTSVVRQFIDATGGHCQIISLGAGFDTLYWRLKETNQQIHSYVEVDFSSVTAKKIRLIRKPHAWPTLPSFFSQPIKDDHHTDLHAGDYHLIGADLRQIAEFDEKLNLSDLDPELPTLVLAECVLVYMAAEKSHELLNYLSNKFKTIGFLNYEQVNTDDRFGEIMVKNLKDRGIHLPGLAICTNLDSQKNHFRTANFETINAWTVLHVYQKFFSPSEIERIESIERLDEKELLTQLLEHYSFVYAFKDGSGNHHELAEIHPK